MSTVQQLPNGRHGLPRRFVAAHQQSRILRAVAKIIESEGYDACSVSRVIDKAGVSRKTFYAFYVDRPDAFLAAAENVLFPDVILTGIPELDAAGWRITKAVA